MSIAQIVQLCAKKIGGANISFNAALEQVEKVQKSNHISAFPNYSVLEHDCLHKKYRNLLSLLKSAILSFKIIFLNYSLKIDLV